MPGISRGLFRWIFHRGATLEDFADRLNHFWTFGLLLVLGCIVSWNQGYSNPIQCWAPAQMTSQMVQYLHTLCWNSHFIRYPRDVEKAKFEIEREYNISITTPFFVMDAPSVGSKEVDEHDTLFTKMVTKRTLYQWLPLILCLQALLFKLPNITMYIFHGYSGVSFDKLACLTSGYDSMQLQERNILGRQVGRYFYNWCDALKQCLPWRFLTLLWLIVKILYFINIIVQMCLIDAFLTPRDPPYDNTTSYGDVIIGNIFQNNATVWNVSPSFPRAVLCDFQILQLANIQTWTVQCFLPANQFNEFVYMFIWVWLLIVAIVTCLSLVVWITLTVVPVFRKRYIMKAFALSEDTDPKALSCHDVNKFCDFVGEDGIMALKVVAANSSEIFVSKIVCSMWNFKVKGVAYMPPEYGASVTAKDPRQTLVQQQPTAPSATVELYPLSDIKKME